MLLAGMVLNTLTLTGWNINRDTSLQRPEWPERTPVKCLRKTATEAKTPRQSRLVAIRAGFSQNTVLKKDNDDWWKALWI